MHCGMQCALQCQLGRLLKQVLNVSKPHLVHDPKPKVMYMGHIHPTGQPSALPLQDSRLLPPITPPLPNSISLLDVSTATGGGVTGRCQASGWGNIEYTAVQYLSKFSSGLFFLHASMRYEVVEHLPYEEKRGIW